MIHRCDVDQYDIEGFRLNWRPDNTAKVTRIEQDLTGFVRCSSAAVCQVAEFCAFGKPHAPRETEDNPGRCFDYSPYTPGGVNVWAEPFEAN